MCSGPVEEAPLTIRSDMLTIVRAMARPDSGLEVRDRLWLKIVIPNAFIGTFSKLFSVSFFIELTNRRTDQQFAAFAIIYRIQVVLFGYTVPFWKLFGGLTVVWTGAEVVDWLHTRLGGLEERRDARKLASQMLRAGYIRHTVNKYTFSEQCYYVFGDLCSGTVPTPPPPPPPSHTSLNRSNIGVTERTVKSIQ